MQHIDPMEIANILATELWCQQLANLEGLQSGVPTRTTATITPTQLRNFEQTYIELTNCRSEPTHVGFVPPAITHSNYVETSSQGSYYEAGGALHVSPGPLSASGDSSSSPGLPQPKRRNCGGRRPNKQPHNISPEEEERRRIRRERNKQAAARCRKRRLDHTNELQSETDQLEERKHALQEEIRKLTEDKTSLETLLKTHMLTCRLPKRSPSPPDVKPFTNYNYLPADGVVRVKEEVLDPSVDLGLDNDIFSSPTAEKRIMLSAANPAVVTGTDGDCLQTPPAVAMSRPNRPTFLQVQTTLTPQQMHNNKQAQAGNKLNGVEITTPSNCISSFNFDSLMDGGTGLTPVHPHPLPLSHLPPPPPCSRQAPEITSPDHQNSLVSL